MVELVAARGYEALTVRGLTKRARISSGTFYNHYRSTDDCLLSTFDLICRRASERLVEAGKGEPEPLRRLTLAIDRLFQDIAASPQAAAFMLRAAPAAGPAFVGTLRNSGMRLGTALELCLRSDGGPHLPPLLLEGVVAGLARIGRVRVSGAERDETGGIAAEAAEWIMSLCVPATRVDAFPNAAAPRRSGNGLSVSGRPQNGDRTGATSDERAMILAAAFRIARRGYHQLTVSRICREAGVARRDFHRHFTRLEDCFTAALEQRVTEALTVSVGSLPPSSSWITVVYRALAALRGAVEGDADGARVLFVEISAAGTKGIDSRDRLISQVARTLRAAAPAGRGPSELEAEASIAAAWAILRGRIAEERFAATAELSTLAFLLLAPAVGGPAALRAMEGKPVLSARVKKRFPSTT